MARVTNVDKLTFPVSEEGVYLENSKKPLAGFKAIVGEFDGGKKVFSVVSSDYLLVPNAKVIAIGKELHQKMFDSSKPDDFQIFNLNYPETRSYCSIDIIDKHYDINVWKQEVYIPFIRIHNSYNKSRVLQFDIGFVRKLCDNGVIFEQETVKFKFSHTRREIDWTFLEEATPAKLKELEEDFKKKIIELEKITIPAEHLIPLSAKVLDKKFLIDSKSEKVKQRELFKLQFFKEDIKECGARYRNNGHFTGYSFQNVITDYASNGVRVLSSNRNTLQRRCGSFLKTFSSEYKDDDAFWGEYLKDQKHLLN